MCKKTEILEPYGSGGVLGVQRGAEGGGAELSPSHGFSRVIFCLSCHVTPSAKGKKKKKKKDLLVPKEISGGRRDCWERFTNT